MTNISIVIVSYNTKELLLDCLKSIVVASVGINSEIFVVDNASSDKTVEAVQKNFSQVKIIANKKNVGFSKANNQALKHTKGDHILVLNPDTKLEKTTLSKMISFMKNKKDVGIATCRVDLPSGNLDTDCRRHFPTPWRAFCHFSGLSKIFRGTKIFDQYYMGYLSDAKEHEVDSCVGAFMFIKKHALDEVGFFDEDYFFYGEDLDLCWRFWEKGWKVVYTPVTKIIHYKGAASGIKPPSMHLSKATQESKRRAVKESTRAMELFYAKHFKGKYNSILTGVVILGVKILEKYRLIKIQYLQ